MARKKPVIALIVLILNLMNAGAAFSQGKVVHVGLAAPVVISFTPAVAGTSAVITITGKNLAGTNSVAFGGAAATSFIIISDNTLIAMVGAGASGSVAVTTPGGQVAVPGFTYVPAPAISYQGPKVYQKNKIITAFSPVNSGGAVPKKIYGQVSVFAGSGSVGSADGVGAAASFNLPAGILSDAAGNLYVGDSGNALVREITPAGLVSTFAGSVPGHLDGPGTAAQFGNPFGVASDAAGNLYVSDEMTGYVRKITPLGVVTTLAGNGAKGFSNGKGATASFNMITGLALDAFGNIYVADQVNNLVRKVTPDGTVSTLAGNGAAGFADGAGAAAQFNYPTGILTDVLGNVYVSDRRNNRIRKISPQGVVGTIAGNGTAGSLDGTAGAANFNQPGGMAVDAYGNIYVADAGNNRIRRITPTGEVNTLAGNGAMKSASGIGTAASFSSPAGIALNNSGEAFIAEPGGNIISKLELTGYAINKPLPVGLIFDAATGTISGTPTAALPATNYIVTAYNLGGSSSTVINITVDNAVPTATDPPNISYPTPQVYPINTTITPLVPTNTGGAATAGFGSYQVTTYAGSGNSGGSDGNVNSASFDGIAGVMPDAAGNVYVADFTERVRVITPAGNVQTVAGTINTLGYVNGPATTARFNGPTKTVMDAAGNIYVTDTNNHTIRKISAADGTVSTFAGTGAPGSDDGPPGVATFDHPEGLVIDAAGNLYTADFSTDIIRKIAPDGTVSTIAGKAGVPGSNDGNSTAARFWGPEYLAIDAGGNLYVDDYNNNKIRKITPAGVVTTLAGNGTAGFKNGAGTQASFNAPRGLAVDASGNVYVADEANEMIRKITPAGVVSTFAGSGAFGAANGDLLTASFKSPFDIAIDDNGDFYVADTDNDLIRKISQNGYTIDKDLPRGMHFDPKTGTISGTPIASSPATDYTVTAYNGSGHSSTVVNITVTGIATTIILPPDISYQTPQTYIVNKPVVPLAPTNKGDPIPGTGFGQVTTFAGSGNTGMDNGPAITATFFGPAGLIFDKADNLYVSEFFNSDIRKITPAGVVSTLAGNGNQGADNGTGAAATFFAPYDLTTDANGNIYVGDEGNNLIRKVTPAGVVSTFAGTGLEGRTNGPALTAMFDTPLGVVTDAAGNIYVADTENGLIRKIDVNGQVSTFAVLDQSIGYLGIDKQGNIYAPDNNQIKKITPAGVITVLAGSTTAGFANGTGTAAKFNRINDVTVDPAGNVYVADADNNMIRMVTPAGVVTTVAGSGARSAINGPSAEATFFAPYGLALDGKGNIYVADAGNHLIRKVALTGYTIDKDLPPGMTFDPATGIIAGTPTVIWPVTIYTITGYNAGGSSTTTVSIQVIDATTLTFAPLPPKTVCDADFDPGATTTAPVTTGNPPVTYTSDNPAVATTVNNKVHITGAGTANITASDGTSTSTQILTVTAAVTPTINISPGTVDCIGTDLAYQATITNGGANPVYQWQVNGTNQGTNSPNFNSSTLQTNDKITCIFTSDLPCTTGAATSNEETVVLVEQKSASITISSSVTGPVCGDTPITFTASPVNPGSNPVYQWQVNGINEGTNSLVFTSSKLKDGDIVTCTLNSSVMCVINNPAESNGITISLKAVSDCVIIIPNTFTPNNDGINDLWHITALENYPNCLVQVFTRYGQQVFQSIGYGKPWDGTTNNSKLPTGTYYYIIDLRDGKSPLAGYVAIIH